MEKSIRWFGNLIILASLSLLLYIYYPVIMLYLKPTSLATLPATGYYITIPKINAQAQIIPDVDPWKESDYRIALQKGVASARGFASPTSGSGPIFLFAHSSDNPWNITRSNTVFFRLPEVQPGDQIILTQNGHPYSYTITRKQEVWPNQIEFLTTTPDKLILQTCVPIGTSLKRLLVFANPS